MQTSLRARDYNCLPLPNNTLYWFPGFAMAHGVSRVTLQGSKRDKCRFREHVGSNSLGAARYSIVLELKLSDEAAVGVCRRFSLDRGASERRVASAHLAAHREGPAAK